MRRFQKNPVYGSFFITLISTLAMAFGSACGTDPVSMTSALGETDVQHLDYDRFDGVSPLRVKTEGIGLSVSAVLHAEYENSGTIWTMDFASSRSLVSVLSYGADGELGQARLLDSYTFEVRLDGSEVYALLSGESLYLMIHADSGTERRFSGIVSLSPMFVGQKGSSLLWLNPAMELVDMDGQLLITGNAKASSRIRHLSVTSDTGISPEYISTDAKGHWTFLFRPADVRDLLASDNTFTHFTGEDADGLEHRVSASLVLAVEQLGIGSGNDFSL